MKHKITAFIHNLINYDYMLFGAILLIFLVLVILGILLRKKTTLSIIIVIIAFLFVVIAPFIGYKQMHQEIFKNTCEITSQNKLTFTNAIVVYGTLSNDSKVDFSSCKITAEVHKASKNYIKNYIYQFKSFKRMSIFEENILKNKTREFKLIIEPFTYTRGYSLSIEAKCK